jgi:hypothetical protein
MRKAARLKMKMEIKRVITIIHLKFIIALVGYIDTYKKEGVPKAITFGTPSFHLRTCWEN